MSREQDKANMRAFHMDGLRESLAMREQAASSTPECPYATRCDCLGACKRGFAGSGAQAASSTQATDDKFALAREAVQVEKFHWFDVIRQIGEAVNCLPSTFPDGNAHIVEAVRRLTASSTTPTGAASSTQADDRAAFERWAGPQGLRLAVRDMAGSTRLGQYCDDSTQLAWEAFRAASSTTPASGDRERDGHVLYHLYDDKTKSVVLWKPGTKVIKGTHVFINSPATRAPVVDALIAKWREQYEMHGMEWDAGYNRARTTCADELEAALTAAQEGAQGERGAPTP